MNYFQKEYVRWAVDECKKHDEEANCVQNWIATYAAKDAELQKVADQLKLETPFLMLMVKKSQDDCNSDIVSKFENDANLFLQNFLDCVRIL